MNPFPGSGILVNYPLIFCPVYLACYFKPKDLKDLKDFKAINPDIWYSMFTRYVPSFALHCTLCLMPFAPCTLLFALCSLRSALCAPVC
jgi:hypothetical protein